MSVGGKKLIVQRSKKKVEKEGITMLTPHRGITWN
jgi:hypothetical protein